jgi:glycosyltransferase involved in cell wall biosynthesis
MNILFLLKSLDVGGVEQVTVTLANHFSSAGHRVTIWAFFKETTSIASRLNKEIEVVYGNGFKISSKNIKSLRDTLISTNTQVIVNQWGLPFIASYTIKRATQSLHVRKITVYHNNPSTNGRLKEVEIRLEKSHSFPVYGILYIKYFIYRIITALSMRYAYAQSDKYILLSRSFIRGFRLFTGILYPDRLKVITNPITIDASSYQADAEKTKEIIYVGRLDYNQKRAYRIIETWELLEKNFPEWKLTIVGDGEEREHLEQMVVDKHLRHVSFEGFKDPKPYYERASILLLTSAYEGFPLVLAECMSFGVVPVVYNSYPAVQDIIADGADGMMIPYENGKYNKEIAADILHRLMADDELREQMRIKAVAKSKEYSIDYIYKQWMDLFNS